MAEAVNGLVDNEKVGDAVMTAATAMLDSEFVEMIGYAAANGIEGSTFAESMHETAVVVTEKVDFDSNWRGSRQPTGLLPLGQELGSWALKLEQVGLIVQDISEEEFNYEEDSEAQRDEPGTVRRVHRNIEFREGMSHLVRLTRRATKSLKTS
jgi:hypothetical protein